MKKLTIALIAAVVFCLKLNAAPQGIPLQEGAEELHNHAGQTFDATPKDAYIAPAPNPRTGLITLSEKVQKINEWKVPSHWECRSSFSGVSSAIGITSSANMHGRYCSRVPTTKVEEFEKTGTYLITKENRPKYTNYKGQEGARVGALLGTGAGLLSAFVTAFFMTNLLGLAGIVLAGLVLGTIHGYRQGATKARLTPDVFTEKTKFRKERYDINTPEDVFPELA